MPFRIGIFDVTVAVIVLVVVLLPARSVVVRAAYRDTGNKSLTHDIGKHQAQLVADPSDGVAAQKLSELLVSAGHSDWALRIGGQAASHSDSPTVWRSYTALSWAHAERFEMTRAHEFALRALEACRKQPKTCPLWERVRLEMYEGGLAAGIKSGVDPRADPKGFREASRSGTRFIRVKRGMPSPTPSPTLPGVDPKKDSKPAPQ